ASIKLTRSWTSGGVALAGSSSCAAGFSLAPQAIAHAAPPAITNFMAARFAISPSGRKHGRTASRDVLDAVVPDARRRFFGEREVRRRATDGEAHERRQREPLGARSRRRRRP